MHFEIVAGATYGRPWLAGSAKGFNSLEWQAMHLDALKGSDSVLYICIKVLYQSANC